MTCIKTMTVPTFPRLRTSKAGNLILKVQLKIMNFQSKKTLRKNQ